MKINYSTDRFRLIAEKERITSLEYKVMMLEYRIKWLESPFLYKKGDVVKCPNVCGIVVDSQHYIDSPTNDVVNKYKLFITESSEITTVNESEIIAKLGIANVEIKTEQL